LLLAFIRTHSGLSPQLKAKLKEDCRGRAVSCLPELIEEASELILSLSKVQQIQLIDWRLAKT
jgi:hypothetical protein